MLEQIENLKKSRQFLLNKIKDLDTNQLNHIPTRFRNNIIWHIEHLVWAQQDFLIKSGLKPTINKRHVDIYESGTVPKNELDANEIEELKRFLTEPLDLMAKHIHDNDFEIIKGIQGLAFHDWLHIGYVLSMKKLL